MSIKQFPGGIITKNPTAPTTTVAQGIWTLDQATQYTKAGTWPRSPGAPTIGTATDAASGGKVNVTFTAPSDTGSAAITSYIATSSPGNITGTSASSPIQVSGLTNGTSYTFQVQAINGAGTGSPSASSNSATPTAPVTGQQAYTTAGTYSWVAPAGVTKVSVVAVGGGAGGGSTGGGNPYPGGGGGGLGYKNNYAVTPGNSYTVVVGAGGAAGNGSTSVRNGNDSYFVSVCVVKGGKGISGGSSCAGSYTGDGGGNGGLGGSGYFWGAGGGAGGYSGNGGRGYCSINTGQSGAGGGGGGGGAGYLFCYGCCGYSASGGGGGGGVGLLGQGSNGAGGAGASSGSGGSGGGGGSSGSAGSAGGAGTGISAYGGSGGAYGGGGASSSNVNTYGGAGGVGAVRIIWPGNTRSFPSTCTGNL